MVRGHRKAEIEQRHWADVAQSQPSNADLMAESASEHLSDLHKRWVCTSFWKRLDGWVYCLFGVSSYVAVIWMLCNTCTSMVLSGKFLSMVDFLWICMLTCLFLKGATVQEVGLNISLINIPSCCIQDLEMLTYIVTRTWQPISQFLVYSCHILLKSVFTLWLFWARFSMIVED
jgi:hypothetical protein